MTQPQQSSPPYAGIAATLIAADAGTHLTEATVATVSRNAAAAISSIAARTKNVLQSLWLPVDPYKDKQIADFVAQANPILVAAQKATAQTAAAAQSAMLKPMGINSTAVPKLPDDIRVPHAKRAVVTYSESDAEPNIDVTVTPSDATNAALLERPARGFRWKESTGADAETAQHFSVTRLDDIVDGNLVIAQRDAEHQVLNYKGNVVTTSRTRTRTGAVIIGFRRIIHPELSAGGVCGLCVAASDRIYHRETLRPIHIRCRCTSAPVTATFDPGLNLNDSDIKRLYTESGSTSAADLKRTRYTVTHNELGPVLVPAAGETVPYFTTQAPVNLDAPRGRTKTPLRNQENIPHNRDPEKGRTAPTFVGGDGKRTAAQKSAANKLLADLLANIEDA